MARLCVAAHWTGYTGHPPLVAPFPASLSAYPGSSSVPQLAQPPAWTPTSAPTVSVWCQLARITDVDAANWAGPNWGPPPTPWTGITPPVQGDQGYSAAAGDFQVSQIQLIYTGTFPTGLRFTVLDPNGTQVAVFTPTGTTIPPVSIAPANGKGIWTIQIDRAPGATGGDPTPMIVNPTTREPLVGVFGANSENLIG